MGSIKTERGKTKTIRSIAAGLLLLTGILHVIQITTAAAIDAAMIITVTFGVLYLVLGFLLFRENRRIVWLAAILPLVGLFLAAIGMLDKPTLLKALFMAIDIAVAACCFYLIFRKEDRTLAQ
jgi:vacuolar-type H+-ATPase subunit I/STV1